MNKTVRENTEPKSHDKKKAIAESWGWLFSLFLFLSFFIIPTLVEVKQTNYLSSFLLIDRTDPYQTHHTAWLRLTLLSLSRNPTNWRISKPPLQQEPER